MDNIFYILSRSKGFILSSLWEDPGFVIVEAAFCKVPIISSDCDSGPKELIKDNINGILFKSNNIENFLIKFDEFIKLEKNYNKILLNNLKMSKKFTKSYLHHLFRSNELIGFQLITIHNIYFMNNLMTYIRQAIDNDSFEEAKKQWYLD